MSQVPIALLTSRVTLTSRVVSDVIDHVECCPDDQVEGHWMSQCGSRPHIARV